MAQSARTLGVKILDGPMKGTELTCWSETRGSAGAVNIASWLVPGGHEQPQPLAMIQHWVARFSRCPWRWSFGERSKVGYLLPVWRKSRKSFISLGFDTSKTGWPYSVPHQWP